MQVTIDDAEGSLHDLIEAARRGEDVIISDEGELLVKLVPIFKTKFKFGVMAGKLKRPIPDFREPMNEEDLMLWEGKDPKDV